MAGAPSQTDIVTNPMASAQMALNYGPQTQQALRRSQYLADALRQMMTEGSQNIRSGGELGAKLLATAILQRGNNKSQDALIQAMTGDRQATDKLLTADTPLASGYQPPSAPAPATAPPVQPPAADASAPPPQAAAPAAPTGPALSDSDKLNLARAVWGEARGEPSAGQQAVASVILNRARESGKPVGDIIAQPHQFAGFNPQSQGLTPDQLGPIMANIGPLLNGTAPDPTNGADHFFNPALANPSWGQGDGQMIGQHKFMSLGYGGQPPAQGAPNMPPPPMPPDPNGPPAQNGPSPQNGPSAQNVPPFQVASNGPIPMPGAPPGAGPQPPMPNAPGPQGGAPPMPQQQGAPPQGVPNMPPPGAMPQAPPQAGPMPPQGPPMGPGPQAQQGGIPTQVVTQQEWHNAAALLGNWRTHDLGVQELLKLKARAAAPVEMKPGTYWGEDNKPHAVEQFTDQPSAPNAYVQRSNLDNSVHAQGNPAYGSVPSGMVMGSGGAISQVPTQQRQTFRIPGAPGLYVADEKGNPQKVADDNYSVKDVGGTMQELTSSQQYDKATKLTEMYRGAVAAATRPGGISDAELKDNAAQIFSGGVARQFNAKMLDEGQGPWLRLKQIAPEIVSGQRLSPQARQAMLMAMHDYVTEAQGQFNGLAQSKSAYAAQNGVDLSPFIKPLMSDVPGVPDLNAIPTGIQGYAPPSPQAAASQPNYAAEIARRKANGTWKGR